MTENTTKQGEVTILWSKPLYLKELWELYEIAKRTRETAMALTILEKIRKIS